MNVLVVSDVDRQGDASGTERDCAWSPQVNASLPSIRPLTAATRIISPWPLPIQRRELRTEMA